MQDHRRQLLRYHCLRHHRDEHVPSLHAQKLLTGNQGLLPKSGVDALSLHMLKLLSGNQGFRQKEDVETILMWNHVLGKGDRAQTELLLPWEAQALSG